MFLPWDKPHPFEFEFNKVLMAGYKLSMVQYQYPDNWPCFFYKYIFKAE